MSKLADSIERGLCEALSFAEGDRTSAVVHDVEVPDADEPVFFYTPDGPFGAFSNFARFGVALDGAWWPTAEHFFQAQKFHDPAYCETIRRASTAKQAADLGRTRAKPLRPDWDEARVEVMRRVVTAKFETHAALRDLLLSTGDRLLVESAPGDAFWGVGPDGVGENRLGRLLMELRARFREETARPAAPPPPPPSRTPRTAGAARRASTSAPGGIARR